MSLECRNIEVIAFSPGTMKADGVNGSDYLEEDIDLGNEEDWAGYDEEGDCATGVYEMKS